MVNRAQVVPEDSAAPEDGVAAQRFPAPAQSAQVRMVFVCRANRCRSPLAERLTRRRAEQAGLSIAASSMGLLPPGYPAPETGVRAAAEYGIDLSAHRSRSLDRDELLQADLVLASARAEARDLVAQMPQLWPRVYTMKQFAAMAESEPAHPGTDFAAWVSQAGQARSRTVLLGSRADDDVADPMGKSLRTWRRTIEELDALAQRSVSSCAHILPTAKRAA